MRPASAVDSFVNFGSFEYPHRSSRAIRLSESLVVGENYEEAFLIVFGSFKENLTSSRSYYSICFLTFFSWKQMSHKGYSSYRNPPSKKNSDIEASQLSLPILDYGFIAPKDSVAKSEPDSKKKKPLQQANFGSYLLLPDINVNNSMKKLSENPRRDSIASYLMMQQLRSHSARVGDHGSEVDIYRSNQPQQGIQKELSASSFGNSEAGNIGKIKTDRNFEAKRIAEKAIKDGKIFVCNGPYQGLRLSLRKRGWVEKFHTSRENAVNIPKSALMDDDGDKLSSARTEDGVRLAFMSSVVQCHSPTLMFTVKTSEVLNKVLKDNQIVNHFGRATAFTTKVGLSYSLRHSELFTDDLCHFFFPRCYNLSCEEDKQAFIDDYNMTSCMAILKYFVAEHDHTTAFNRYFYRHCHGSPDIARSKPDYQPVMRATESEARELLSLPLMQRENSAKGQKSLPGNIQQTTNKLSGTSSEPAAQVKAQKHVSTKAIRFALDRCHEFIACCKNEDIKKEFEVMKSKWMASKDKHWLDFQDAYRLYVTNRLRVDKKAKDLLPECKKVVGLMEFYWPQFGIDGVLNVWILKPGAKSRGRGIKCTSSLPEIINNYTSSSCVTVAQKYIERPLLIHKTKFDLRQWFLVTDWNPLTVWFYKDAYLRFCSKEFTLRDLHESIHLSNNSVQKNYLPSYDRATQLPPDNMWTSEEFKDFLRINKLPNTWNSIIVPGMKKCILNVLLCTQDNVDHRKESFELFGADFMLTEDYRPWLIEINSSPSMARNTRATACLVNRVLEDTIKVVIDRRQNPTCDTGQFELVYKQTKASDHLATTGSSTVPLFITGDKITEVTRE